MWLYFDKTGRLLEKLEHGTPARAGATEFEIFAYFEGLDINTFYNEATIKMLKPDFLGTEYPLLLMQRKYNEVFQYIDENENSNCFEPNQRYSGFYFNFADFNCNQQQEVLLDTAGNWSITITLISAARTMNVVGQLVLYVQPGIVTEESAEPSPDAVLNAIYQDLATKLDALTSQVGPIAEEDLPYPGAENTLYFVLGENSDTLYTVKMWNASKNDYVVLGVVNLSTYANKEEFATFITNITIQQNDFENNVNAQIEELSAKIASEGPKGVFDTLSELQNTITTDEGKKYIYVVKADSNWYYWDTDTNAWTAGGAYTSPSTVVVSGRIVILQNTSSVDEANRTIVLEL